MKASQFLALAIIATISSTVQGKSCPGIGWTFVAEKCFKLLPRLATYREAQESCAMEEIISVDIVTPRPVHVLEQSEQNYVASVIQNDTSCPGLWLGLTRDQDSLHDFYWESGKTVQFSNWGPEFPSNNSGRGCVEMMSENSLRQEISAATGDWHDVTCSKGNWVLCEKIPPWSVGDMINGILDLQYEQRRLREDIDEL